MEEPMNAIIQRTDSVPLAESPSDAYRFCLDALITTITELRESQRVFRVAREFGAVAVIKLDIEAAEARAAELAARLFDKFFQTIDLSNVTPIKRPPFTCVVCKNGAEPCIGICE
jgi:hypothetical protein